MGFTLKRDKLQRYCQDINECEEYKGLCQNIHCTNTIGSYLCRCKSGFKTIGAKCLDIDECANSTDVDRCPEKSECINSQGSYNCQCYDGYGGDNCVDIDECSIDTAGCDPNANCTNSDQAFKLSYILSTDIISVFQ